MPSVPYYSSIVGTQVQVSGENVGIGTASPAYKLDVAGTGNIITLKINDQYILPTGVGSVGDSLVYTGSNQVAWSGVTLSGNLAGDLNLNNYDIVGTGNITIDGNITAEYFYGDLDGVVITECRNGTASTISEGTPVYVSGYYSSNGKPLVAEANASISSTMPAIGLLASDLASGAEGHVHVFGLAQNLPSAVTNGFSVGETVYVAAGGGLTNVRPTGVSELVQNMGRVLRTGTNGRILVLGPGRSNDVPNSGHFEQLTVDGQTILAKDGGNVGIGTASPSAKLNILTSTSVALDVEQTGVTNNNVGLFKFTGGNVGSASASSAILRVSSNSNFRPLASFNDTTVITAGGNVGIGTATPSYNLDVVGTSRVATSTSDHGLLVGRGPSKASIKAAGNSAPDGYLIMDSYAGILAGVNYYSNGDVILAYGGGDVGIGVNAPSARLNVENGDVAFNQNNGSYTFKVGSTASDNLLYVDGTSNDKVGIGTASPSYKLDVVGRGRFVHTDGSCGLIIEDTVGSGIHLGDCAFSAGNTYAGMKHSSHTGPDEYMIVSRGDHTFLSAASGYDTLIRGGNNNVGCELRVKDVGKGQDAIIFNEQGYDRDVRMEGLYDQNVFHLDASADSIGIGTSLPTAKLEIADDITGSGTLLSLNGTSWGDGETAYLSWNRGGSYVANIGAELTGGATNAHIVFETAANTERMRITSDGKVGIGTASPSPAGGGTSLHIHDTNYPEIKLTNDNTGSTSDDGSVIQVVNSEFRFTNREDGKNISFYAFDTGGTSRQKLILSESLIVVNGAKTNTDFQVKGEVDDDLIRTDANTNRVGIGTATPSQKLDVDGSIRTIDGGVGHHQNGCYIAYPGGGSLRNVNPTQTGYLKITLPVSWTNTMISFDIDVYEYATQKIKKFRVGGYNHSVSTQWINESAMMDSDNDFAKYKVHFGHDGTNCAIYISEIDSSNTDLGSSTTWSYAQVSISNIYAGYSVTTMNSWASGWDIDFTTTLGTTTGSIEVSRPYRQHDNGYVFNEYGGNVDFRIEASGEQNALFVRGSDGNVGIGTATPQAKLDVNGTVEFDDLVRWEHPDKSLDTSTATLGYMRLYDESTAYCGLGVSPNSFNVGSSGLINVRFMGGSGCLERAKIDTYGDFIINENGYPTDFRVEGDTLEYLLHTDGSKDEVVIHNAVGYGLNYATSEGWVQATGTPTTSQVGYYGGNFESNGSTENYIDYSDLPNGSRGLVWQSRDNGTDYGADGGWNKQISGLDPNKTYVSVVYVRRTSSTSSGSFYHGCGQGGYTLNLNGSSNTNPYFHIISAGTLPKDVWCVSIGIIHANNDPTTSSSGFGGVYRLDTGTKINSSSTDYRMASTTTLQNHRTYLYYDTTGNTDLDWCWPGFYEVTADAVVGLLNTILYDHFSGRNITVNEDFGNFDFRVQGVSDTHLLFTDAGTNSVGIGKNLPQTKLDVNGSFRADGQITLGSGSLPFPRKPIELLNSTNISELTVNEKFTFPTTDGSAGQSLVTDGSGVVSWADVASVSANLTRGSFEVTSTQSTFTVSGGYTLNTLNVYYNGVKLLLGTDFTATNGTTFTLTNAAVNGDIVEYWALNSASSAVGNTSTGSVSVTSNQTVFNVTNGYTVGGLIVFVNGVKLVDGVDFTATNGSSFTLTSAATSGDVVDYVAYGAVVASSNLQKTGDTMTGNLTVNADLIVKGYKETHVDNGNTGTSQTISISNSTIQTYTLTGNCTFTMPTADAGRSFTVFLKTGSGSYTASFTNVKWPQNSAPTITTSATRMDILTFYSDGTNWYGNVAQDYYI